MAARRNAGLWLAFTAVALGFLALAHAEVKNIEAGPPPPPLYYASFGVVQVNWTFALTAGTTVTGFEVTVRPLDHMEPFTVAPPSGKNPWFWVSRASLDFSSNVLCMHRVAPVPRQLSKYPQFCLRCDSRVLCALTPLS